MLKRLLVTLVLAAATFAPITLASTTAPASAASAQGWIYISFPTWLGNCPTGARVTAILASVGGTWTTGGRWDVGDDLVYAKVKLRSRQQVSAQILCGQGVRSYYQTVTAFISPTRSNQTAWVGPAGVRYN